MTQIFKGIEISVFKDTLTAKTNIMSCQNKII